MSLFIRDDIPVRQLSPLYKKRARMGAGIALRRFCQPHVRSVGWRTFFPYQITKDFERLYLKGA